MKLDWRNLLLEIFFNEFSFGATQGPEMLVKYANFVTQGSFENEALENEDGSTQISKTKHLSKTKHSKTKYPNLENEAPKNSKTKTPKLETGLSFTNTRQSLSNTEGIKHDNESNSAQIYPSRTVRCCKRISAAAWEAMFWK